jgi:ADP-heptose:LPS heptosyltransferase
LRHAYPDAEITLLSLPWAAALVKRFSAYFDRFVHFPGYPGLPEQSFDEKAWPPFLERMRGEEFDLLLQMQGNGSIVNPMLQTFGARHLAGFYPQDQPLHSPLFMEYPADVPEPVRHVRLMQHLGIPAQGTQLEFPVLPEDQQEMDQLLLPVYNKSYVVVHPGSRSAWRQWPTQYFAAIADYFTEQGYTVVITGTREEAPITREVLKCVHHPVIDLTGKTGLGAVGLLIRNAFMLVANCTGVSHIAAATQTPSGIVSMDGEPERWAPLDKNLHTVIDWTQHPHFETVFDAAVEMEKRLRTPEAVN